MPVHRVPHGGQLTEIMEHREGPQSTTWWTAGQLTEIMEHRASPQSTKWWTDGQLTERTEVGLARLRAERVVQNSLMQT